MKFNKIFISVFMLFSMTLYVSAFNNAFARENNELYNHISVEESNLSLGELEEGYIPVIKNEETNELYYFADYVKEHQDLLDKLANELILEGNYDADTVLQIHEIKTNGKNVLANITIEDYELVKVFYELYVEKLSLIEEKKLAIEEIQTSNSDTMEEFGFEVLCDVTSYILLIKDANTLDEVEEIAKNAMKTITIFFNTKQDALDRLDTYFEYGVNEEDINKIKDSIYEATTIKEVEYILNTFETLALKEAKDKAIETIDSYILGYNDYIDKTIYVKLINAATTIEQVEAELIAAYSAIETAKAVYNALIAVKVQAVATLEYYLEELKRVAKEEVYNAYSKAVIAYNKAIEVAKTIEEVSKVVVDATVEFSKNLMLDVEDKIQSKAEKVALGYAKEAAILELELMAKLVTIDITNVCDDINNASSIEEVKTILKEFVSSVDNQLSDMKQDVMNDMINYAKEVLMAELAVYENMFNVAMTKYYKLIEAAKTLEEVKDLALQIAKDVQIEIQNKLTYAKEKAIETIRSCMTTLEGYIEQAELEAKLLAIEAAKTLEEIEETLSEVAKIVAKVLLEKTLDKAHEIADAKVLEYAKTIALTQINEYAEMYQDVDFSSYVTLVEEATTISTIQTTLVDATKLVAKIELDIQVQNAKEEAVEMIRSYVDMVNDHISLDNYMDKINSYIGAIENATSIEEIKKNLKSASMTVVGMILGSYDIYGDEIADILGKIEVNAEAIQALQDILYTEDSNGNTLIENIANNTEIIATLQNILLEEDEDGNTLIDRISNNKEAIDELGKLIAENIENVDSLKLLIEALTGDIEINKETISNIQSIIDGLEKLTGENSQNIEKLDMTIDKIYQLLDGKASIQQVEEYVKNLNDLIGKNVENIDKLESAIDFINKALDGKASIDTINELLTSINANKDEIEKILTTIDELKNQLTKNGLEIGEVAENLAALALLIEKNEINIDDLNKNLAEYKKTLDEIEKILGTDGMEDNQTIIEKIEAINNLLVDYDSYKENIDKLGVLVEDLNDTIDQVQKEQEDSKSLSTKKVEAIEEFKTWIIAYLNVLVEEYKAQQALLPQNSTLNNGSFGLSTKLKGAVVLADADEETVEAIKSLLTDAGFSQDQINEFVSMYNDAIKEINAATAVEDIQPKLDLFKEDLRQYATSIVAPNSTIDLTYVYVGMVIGIALLIVIIILLIILICKKKTVQPVEQVKTEDDNNGEENTLLTDEESLISDVIEEENEAVVEEIETTDEELNEEMEDLTTEEDLEEVEALEESEETLEVEEIETTDEELNEEMDDLTAEEALDDEDETLDEDLIDVEESEETLEDIVDPITGETVKRTYKPFIDRILESSGQNQEYYNAIKNELLSYRKIRSRVSKKGDNFRLSRVLKVRIAMGGKTLKLFLSLNPADFDENVYYHKDMSHKKSCETVPMLVKVKSNRGLKRAIELITILMANNNVEMKSRHNEKDFIEELRLMKELEESNESFVEDETVVVDEDIMGEESNAKTSVERKPFVPFKTRIVEANEQTKENYNLIKNELLSYKNIRCITSNKFESFRISRELQAKLVMSGITLKLFLALNPTDFDTNVYFHKDMSQNKAYEETPLMIKLRSKRSVKKAIELITKLMENKEISKKSRYQETNRIEELQNKIN